MHSDQFVEAIRRVAGGGTAMDPEVIARLLARNTDNDVVSALIPCEREVRGLMAEGWSNATIGQQLAISGYVVAKHWPPTVRRRQSPRPGGAGVPQNLTRSVSPRQQQKLVSGRETDVREADGDR
jgi:hypothetical protein